MPSNIGSMRVVCGIAVALASVRAMAQSTPNADAQEQELKQKREQAYQACLSTDENCTYGTSNRCAPSVPFGDRWGARRILWQVRQIAQDCKARSGQWATDCYQPKIAQILEVNQFAALAPLISEVGDRLAKLPGGGAPACWDQTLPIPQVVTDLPGFCQTGQKLCIDGANTAERQLDCARDTDEWLYTREAQAARDKLKADHDAQCKQTLVDQETADAKQIAGERSSEAAQAKQAEDKKKQDEANRKAAEDKKQSDREAAEKRREAEIQKRQMIHDRYVQEQRVADAQNQQNAANIAAVMGSMSGGGNEPYGPGTYRHFELGMGFEAVPIEGVLSGSDVMTGSTSTSGFGLGFKGGFEYAPLHRPWLTLGGYVGFMSGGMALAGGTSYVLDVDGGLFGSVGPEAGTSIVGRLGFGFRVAGTSSDSGGGIIDATTIGSDAYSYQKLRAGIRWCTSAENSDKEFCESSIALTIGTDIHANLGDPIVLGIEWDIRRFLDIGAEVGIQYPRDTTAASTTKMPFDDPGLLISFHISHSWDHFSGSPPPEPAPAAPPAAEPEPAEPDEATPADDAATPSESSGSDASGSDVSGSDSTQPAPTDASTLAGDSATIRPATREPTQPARTATVEPRPQPDASAQMVVLPPLAHERRRFSLVAGVPISCESLHGDFSGADYGGCGAGLRVGADSPIGGVHADLLGAGFGSMGVRLGLDLGTTFKRLTGNFAYALRATGDFEFESYDGVSGGACVTTALQYCPTGAKGVANGNIQVLDVGGMAAGSYTLGSHSLEGGVGLGYSAVTYDGQDGSYEVGKGSGWFFRLLVGARL